MVQEPATGGACYQGIAGPATEHPGHSDGVGSKSLKRLYAMCSKCRLAGDDECAARIDAMAWSVKPHLRDVR